jgi:exodeoxyribonuclease VII small subunit
MTTKKPSYEEKVEELEAILRRLDDAETPIDTLAEDVKKGASLIKELDHKLRDVETQVRDAFAELEAVQSSEA